jgi:hypothetical protein
MLRGEKELPASTVFQMKANSALGNLAEEAMGGINRVYQASLIARFFYSSAPYAGKLEVLLSEDDPHYGSREEWQRMAAEVTIQTVPGAHSGENAILREPNLPVLAARLSELIGKAG